jgi:AraC-like DNA-binding protein
VVCPRFSPGFPRSPVFPPVFPCPRFSHIDHRPSSDDNKVPTTPPRAPSGSSDAWDFLTALRAIIRPYLAQGHPPLSLVAEIIGTSERTLQRRLAQSRMTYSQIVQEARFSIASDLLADSDLNMTDIAFATGYDNAPHFSRAFKRLTGVTPSDYRCARAWRQQPPACGRRGAGALTEA